MIPTITTRMVMMMLWTETKMMIMGKVYSVFRLQAHIRRWFTCSQFSNSAKLAENSNLLLWHGEGTIRGHESN